MNQDNPNVPDTFNLYTKNSSETAQSSSFNTKNDINTESNIDFNEKKHYETKDMDNKNFLDMFHPEIKSFRNTSACSKIFDVNLETDLLEFDSLRSSQNESTDGDQNPKSDIDNSSENLSELYKEPVYFEMVPEQQRNTLFKT
ncbi:hypothetical protein NEIG_00832 [Nematocida sp. ERTm5]|nr:hypothetical protein NEIG_00832 [Nematocida sp. ERTm5]